MVRKRQIDIGETLPGFSSTHATPGGPALAPVAEVVRRFHALYFAAYGTKPAVPARYLRDLKGHVERTGTSEALTRLERLFAGEGPRWLKPPHDLATFVTQYDKLAAPARPRPSDLLRGVR